MTSRPFLDVPSHQPYLLALARALGSRDAEDAVQDTWVSALQNRADGSRRPWLSRVLRHQVVDQHRRHQRREDREGRAARPEHEPAATEVLEQEELALRVRRGLDSLPEDERSALELRYLADLPPREIARQSGQPLRVVYKQLERGRERLRRELQGEVENRRLAGVALALGAAPLSRATVGSFLLGAWGVASTVAAVVMVSILAWNGSGSSGPGSGGPVSPLTPTPGPAASAEELHALGDLEAEQAMPEETSTRTSRAGVPAVSSADVGHLEVQVRLASGEPPKGVTVRTQRTGSGGAAAGGASHHRVDGEGRVRIAVPTGQDQRLVVTTPMTLGVAPEIVQSIVGLAPGEVRTLSIEIPVAPQRNLFARVVRASDGTAISGARALALGQGDRLLARTGPGGELAFSVPREGLGVVRVVAAGYGPALFHSANEGRAEHEPFAVRMREVGTLVVRAPAHADDALLLRVEYEIDELAQPLGTHLSLSDPVREQSSDERGMVTLRFDDLPSGVGLRLEAFHGARSIHRTADPIVLEAGEERILVVPETPRTFLIGQLRRNDGTPVPDREVWILRPRPDEGDVWRALEPGERDLAIARATTDGSGFYEFTDVEPGQWWIGPAPAEDEVAPFAQFHEQGTALETRLDLVAHVGLYLRGTVEMKGLEGRIQVYADRSDLARSIRVPLDGNRFEVGPLVPGTWAVHATHDFFQRTAHRFLDLQSTSIEGIVLSFESAPSVSGQVFDDLTGAPQKAHVRLVRDSGSSGMGTGEEGHFDFPGQREGTYSIAAGTEDGRVALLAGVQVGAGGRQGIELRVRQAGRLQLELGGERTRVRCQIRSRGELFADFTLRRGVPVVEPVPAGGLNVVLYGHGDDGREEYAVRELVLGAGELEELAFELD